MDKLADRIGALPLILAGPILRRVTKKSVTVWVAVQQSAKATLEIYSGDPGTRVKVGSSATLPTIAIGRSLHILAITAQASLSSDVIYTYDMFFDVPESVSRLQLAESVPRQLSAVRPTDVPHPLSYPPYELPSFSLPPENLNDLRIIHGSCRMPHGNGNDALSFLDDLIRTTAQNATQRPHQLLLTGDQIYADDVAASLLMQLMEASTTLLGTDPKPPVGDVYTGWRGEETLPALDSDDHSRKPSELIPLLRCMLLKKAGFTSDDLRCHLISFGEYLAMYLFVWSDVLWPNALPTPDEVRALVSAHASSDEYRFSLLLDKLRNQLSEVKSDNDDVANFRMTLPNVRRALANIPSYMICDDHEVTDDWNMTRDFCNRVYGTPLGRRIVQNALVAYALCQHWGNAPEQFDVDVPGGNAAAGQMLLRYLDKGTTAGYDICSSQLSKIVAVHDSAAVSKGVFHDQDRWLTIDGIKVSADSLLYNYTIEGSKHQVIVTDTRTWRSYPGGDKDPPHLLPVTPTDQFKAQIDDAPETLDRMLLVVVTTNAPPIEPIRVAMQHDSLINVYDDLFESWEPPWVDNLLMQKGRPSVPFDRLLVRLTNRVPTVAGKLRGQVILLSGDVHHSFASRLIYRAQKARFEDPKDKPVQADVVFAQLVASSFKKAEQKSEGLHDAGYTYPGPLKARMAAALAGISMPPNKPEGYVGWNIPPGSSLEVGTLGGIPLEIKSPTICIEQLPVYPIPSLPVNLERAPDYRYRLDYLAAEAQSIQPVLPMPVPPPSGDTTPEGRKKTAVAFNLATGNYRVYNQHLGDKREIVGLTNISEITFSWNDTDETKRQVHNTVRWGGGSAPVLWTRYTVSLNPDDQDYLDKKATSEP